MNFPKAQALVAYHAEPPGISWEEMLDAHEADLAAAVFSTSRIFVAARLVRSEWDDDQLLDPRQCDVDGDALHVYVAAGSLPDLLDFIPRSLRARLKWFTFQRRGYRVHRLPASRLLG